MENVNEGLLDFLDSKRKQIEKNLTLMGIDLNSCEITKDYIVNAKGNIYVNNKMINKCPVQFGNIQGNFIWHFSNLSTLEGMPKSVSGNFIVSNNKLTSLEGSPETVGGLFNCNQNKLKNLVGGPTNVHSYHCSFCGLESLDGSPKNVRVDFVCNRNNLTTLKGSPKRIFGIFDCSDNKLTTLTYMPICTRVILSNNPLSNDPQLHIPLDYGFVAGDKIIYDKPGSKWDKFTGTILSVDKDQSEIKYSLRFDKESNKIDKDATILNIKGEYIRKKDSPFQKIINDLEESPELSPSNKIENSDKIEIGDTVVCGDNFRGEIKKALDFNLYMVKFEKSGEYVVHSSNMRKVKKDQKIDIPVDSVLSDKPGLPSMISTPDQKELNIKNSEEFKNNPHVGDAIVFANPDSTKIYGFTGVIKKCIEVIGGSKNNWSCDIVLNDPDGNKKIELIDVPVRYLRRMVSGKIVNPIKKEILKSEESKTKTDQKKDSLKINDRVIYLDPDGKYDNCKGVISSIKHLPSGQIYDIQIKDKTGAFVFLTDISKNKLEKFKEEIKRETREEIPKDKALKKGDKIIYTGDRKDNYGNDMHNCKGIINYINDWQVKSAALDLISKKGAKCYLYNVDLNYIERISEKFKKGDKVKYDNKNDRLLDTKIGIVVKSEKDTYNVTFNTFDSIITVTGIEGYSLEKYEPTDVDFSIDDDIIYTKPDSPNYGCRGTIIGYDLNDDTYELEIMSRNNKKIKVRKTKVENMEKTPPKRDFKKGDKIRYINSSNVHNGAIGTVTSKMSKEGRYEVELVSGTNKIHMSANADNLVLLEECAESEKFYFGQKLLYKKSDSKWNNKIGKFQGIRQSDGKLEVKFENEKNTEVKVFIDADDAPFLEPTEARTVSTTSSTVDTNRKKKKKEKEPPQKPVLVYNRRHTASRTREEMLKRLSEPPEPEPMEPEKLKVGDKVKVIKLATSSEPGTMLVSSLGKEGIVDNDNFYSRNLAKTPLYGVKLKDSLGKYWAPVYYYRRDQLEKLKDDN